MPYKQKKEVLLKIVIQVHIKVAFVYLQKHGKGYNSLDGKGQDMAPALPKPKSIQAVNIRNDNTL